MAETTDTDSRWPMSLIRRGAKVPDDGTRWWQEMPEGHTADGIRDLGYEVVDVVPAREEREEEPVVVEGRESATSLRLYLTVADDEDLEAVTDRITDVLLEMGFNGGDRLDAVITCVPETPDVVAWAEGPEEFSAAVTEDAAFLLVPSAEGAGELEDEEADPQASTES